MPQLPDSPSSMSAPSMTSARQSGFGLIEIMVALMIMAILAAVAYPSYLESVRKAKRAEGRAALVQLMQQQERSYARNNAYTAFSRASPNGFKWFSANTASASAYEINASACKDGTLQDCVLLTAQPGTAHVDANYRDEACGSLSLSSDGSQGASGGNAGCW